ncbi:hypothetical protein O6H91_03G077000 [Diphasiastrum complanatum]|uniref:Uncharacterized protein n=1 Tax=Diphasiastrum complanatum TaxID=34168 RepID=A0ACC2E7Z5_DIPCM|nr:hypothetical protein O6H91_03G077000 [Diphasiastrum complanatum]
MQGMAALTGVQCTSTIAFSKCVHRRNSVLTCLNSRSLSFIAASNEHGRNARKREVRHGAGDSLSFLRTFLVRRSISPCKVTAAAAEDKAVAESQDLQTTKVRFMLQKDCLFGEQFNVVGGDPLLGAWDPLAALALEWTDGHIWTLELDVPVGKIYEYKFMLTGKHGKIEWQPGSNRNFQTLESSSLLIVSEPWEVEEPLSEEDSNIQTEVKEATTNEAKADGSYDFLTSVVVPDSLGTEPKFTHVGVNGPPELANETIDTNKTSCEEFPDQTGIIPQNGTSVLDANGEHVSAPEKPINYANMNSPTILLEVSKEVSKDAEETTVTEV